jgi:hypothetical protein
MESLPELDRLSVAEKEALIGAQVAQIQVLVAEGCSADSEDCPELEGRLALNSGN